jgi:hypothetical protein
MKMKKFSPRRSLLLFCLICGALLFSLTQTVAKAQAQQDSASAPKAQSGTNLGEIGAKLANPLSELWSLQFNLQAPQFYDGDVNTGDPQLGANMIFQPVMPIPLYGTGAATWRLITRPIIPLIFSEPIPTGFDEFDHVGGLGDIQLPAILSLPEKYAGHFILGAGPVGLFPTATDDDLGQDQWALGPAAVFGYKTKKLTAGVFPNYFWKIGSSGQDEATPDISQGSMLYFLIFNLPDAWQIGMNPTITYNDQAKPDDRWNVPVGLLAGKTIKIGKVPVNIKVAAEYSVVSPDAFGQRFQFKFQITPVIPGLIKNPIFGK